MANRERFKDVPLLSKFFNGSYNDFSYDWYGHVGNQLMMAMIINAICPLIEFTIERILGCC